MKYLVTSFDNEPMGIFSNFDKAVDALEDYCKTYGMTMIPSIEPANVFDFSHEAYTVDFETGEGYIEGYYIHCFNEDVGF